MSTGSLLVPEPVKWTYIHALADDLSAEAWHENEWLPALAKLDGVDRVVAHRTRVAPQPEDVSRPLNAWSGLVEVHLRDPDVLRSVLAARVQEHVGGRFTAVRGLLSTVREEYDLRRDVPSQQHPYLTEPIDWKSGPPPADEPSDADLWRYVYFFRYRDEVPWVDGEDWYLGHHTREGRQLPGLRRYVTWRRRRDDLLDPATTAQLNGFARYTELCFESFEAWHRSTHSRGPRWRMDERYPSGVWTDYQHLFIGTTPDIDTTA